MDITGDDWPFLVLIIFGLIVLSIGVVYCLCRIFCYDFWNRCCTRFSHRVFGGDSSSSGDRARELDEKEMRENSFIKKIVLGRGKGSKGLDSKKNDAWATRARKLRRDSFDVGDEEDEIIYRIEGSNGAPGPKAKQHPRHHHELDRMDSQASFQLDSETTRGAFKPIKPKRVGQAQKARRASKGYY